MGVAEVSLYSQQGFSGPHRALTAGEAIALATRVSTEVVGPSQEATGPRVHCRHLDNELIYDLCSLPVVLDRVADLLGSNLVLWRSNVWHKAPGAPAVAWHQDFNHWPLNPMINVSVWLALTEATVENGCVQVVPGTHREVRDVLTAGRGDPFDESVAVSPAEEAAAIPMVLEPGEFFVFSEKLVHRSGINRGTSPRTGVVSRLTTPTVEVDHAKLLGGEHRNIVVRGEDNVGLNALAEPPTAHRE